jgi:hypothetical protein
MDLNILADLASWLSTTAFWAATATGCFSAEACSFEQATTVKSKNTKTITPEILFIICLFGLNKRGAIVAQIPISAYYGQILSNITCNYSA